MKEHIVDIAVIHISFMMFVSIIFLSFWIYFLLYYEGISVFQLVGYWLLFVVCGSNLFVCGPAGIVMLKKETKKVHIVAVKTILCCYVFTGVLSIFPSFLLSNILGQGEDTREYLHTFFLANGRVPHLMDYIQRTHHCCGHTNYTDYLRQPITSQKGSVQPLPTSCCSETMYSCDTSGLIYQDGCFLIPGSNRLRTWENVFRVAGYLHVVLIPLALPFFQLLPTCFLHDALLRVGTRLEEKADLTEGGGAGDAPESITTVEICSESNNLLRIESQTLVVKEEKKIVPENYQVDNSSDSSSSTDSENDEDIQDMLVAVTVQKVFDSNPSNEANPMDGKEGRLDAEQHTYNFKTNKPENVTYRKESRKEERFQNPPTVKLDDQLWKTQVVEAPGFPRPDLPESFLQSPKNPQHHKHLHHNDPHLEIGELLHEPHHENGHYEPEGGHHDMLHDQRHHESEGPNHDIYNDHQHQEDSPHHDHLHPIPENPHHEYHDSIDHRYYHGGTNHLDGEHHHEDTYHQHHDNEHHHGDAYHHHHDNGHHHGDAYHHHHDNGHHHRDAYHHHHDNGHHHRDAYHHHHDNGHHHGDAYHQHHDDGHHRRDAYHHHHDNGYHHTPGHENHSHREGHNHNYGHDHGHEIHNGSQQHYDHGRHDAHHNRHGDIRSQRIPHGNHRDSHYNIHRHNRHHHGPYPFGGHPAHRNHHNQHHRHYHH